MNINLNENEIDIIQRLLSCDLQNIYDDWSYCEGNYEILVKDIKDLRILITKFGLDYDTVLREEMVSQYSIDEINEIIKNQEQI